MTDVLWSSAPERPFLAGGEVHVWATSLESSRARAAHLSSLLTDSERLRAKRFRFSRDAQRFVTSRGTLRLILSRYLGLEAGRIKFSHGPQGKPHLTEPHSCHLKFNLSRSGDLALFAISRGVDVGVDVERIVAFIEVDQMAERILSLAERARLSGLNDAKKLEAVYAGWVSKEAILKASGEGLANGFDASEASVIGPGTNWLIHLFDIPGYKAAVAVEARSAPVSKFYWFRPS